MSDFTKKPGFTFCTVCTKEGYCRKMVVPMVTDAEISDPVWLTGLKNFLVFYAATNGITPAMWWDHLTELYRDYLGMVTGASGDEVFVDPEIFDTDYIREWFRGFVRLVPVGVRPYVTEASREKVRALATIMRAHNPEAAMLWGLEIGNDRPF